MKSNNLSRNIRIKNRINKLHSKKQALEPIPYGKPNPYYKCASCERSMVEVSYAGHYKGCKYVGLEKEIEYWTKELSE